MECVVTSPQIEGTLLGTAGQPHGPQGWVNPLVPQLESRKNVVASPLSPVFPAELLWCLSRVPPLWGAPGWEAGTRLVRPWEPQEVAEKRNV